jgi:hypothetical protein
MKYCIVTLLLLVCACASLPSWEGKSNSEVLADVRKAIASAECGVELLKSLDKECKTRGLLKTHDKIVAKIQECLDAEQ